MVNCIMMSNIIKYEFYFIAEQKGLGQNHIQKENFIFKGRVRDKAAIIYQHRIKDL